MNEPRKTFVTLIVVLAIGLSMLAVEWIRDKGKGWLWLIMVSIVLLVMALGIHARAG